MGLFYKMTFSPDDVVSVMGFCFLLWWMPKPYQLLPAIAALVFPLYPSDAAFTTFVMSLFLGALVTLLDAVTGGIDK